MQAFYERAKTTQGIEETEGFNAKFWYWVAIGKFRFSDEEFWRLTVKKLYVLVEQEEKMNKQNK